MADDGSDLDIADLPDAVNGWQLVGARPSRVVYAGADHPSMEGRRLHLEAGRGRAPGTRRAGSAGTPSYSVAPWAVWTDLRRRPWETADRTHYVADAVPSLEAAVAEAIEYMRRVPPTTGRLEMTYQESTSLIQHTAAFVFDELFGDADAPYADRTDFQAEYDWHAANNRLSLVDHEFTPREVAGDDRVAEDVGRGLLRLVRQLHPDALQRAHERAHSDDRLELGYMQTSGDFGSLEPQTGQSGLSRSDPNESAFVQSADRGRDRTGPSRRANPQKTLDAQRFQGPNLEQFGIDPEELEPDIDPDERDVATETRERISEEVQKFRGAQGDTQKTLAGDDAVSPALFENLAEKRRREQSRAAQSAASQRELSQRGLGEWEPTSEGEQRVKDAIEEANENENGNGNRDGDVS